VCVSVAILAQAAYANVVGRGATRSTIAMAAHALSLGCCVEVHRGHAFLFGTVEALLDGEFAVVKFSASHRNIVKIADLIKVDLRPLDCVRVHGLSPDEDKGLNGQVGIVVRYFPEVVHFEVSVNKKLCKLRPCNIQKVEAEIAVKVHQGEAATANEKTRTPPDKKVQEMCAASSVKDPAARAAASASSVKDPAAPAALAVKDSAWASAAVKREHPASTAER